MPFTVVQDQPRLLKLFRADAIVSVWAANLWKPTAANHVVPSCRKSFVELTCLRLHHHPVIRMLFISSGS